MKPDLENWLKAGWLTQHKTSPREIADLLAVADRDLKSAESPGLDADWKHNIAYSSALNCTAAALAASGYRPSREQHHYRLIHSLPLVMGKELSKATDRLECARRKRNIGIYERAGVISEGEAGEMLSLARNLRHRVEEYLRQSHPELV